MLLSSPFNRWGNWSSERLKDLVQDRGANRVAMGPGLTTSFSVFRCSVHSTPTFWALSACDETLFLSAVLNKDCVYNGVAWHLGAGPSGSWVATIKKIISDITLMLLLWRYWNFVPHDNLQCPPHSGHGSGLNINGTFHYRQFVVRGEVLQWLFGWWPAVRRWRREEIQKMEEWRDSY